LSADGGGRFKGKSVLIAGAAQGIGRACAEFFAAQGARLTLFDVEGETLSALARGLAAAGHRVYAVTGDVSVAADVDAAVAAAVRHCGGIDVLVHTAAIVELAPLLEVEEERWRRIVDVNLTGLFLTTRAAGRVMAQQDGGCIVALASTNAFFAEELNVPYSTTKGGVVMFVRNAALDLAPHRIRINAVDPGIIDTRLSAALIHDSVAGPEYLKRIPIGRYGTAEDIAKVVAFLASDDAGYMTGEDVIADGGLTLGASLGIDDLQTSPQPSS
jgi:3-oxoacyl-[acyl-carrier protein] reductase